MNILLVVPWDQEYGGVASVVGNLARQFQKQGHQTFFLHPGENDALETRRTKWLFPGYRLNLREPFLPDFPLKSIGAFFYYLLPTLRQLWQLLSKNNIDIVHIHYPGESGIYFALLRRFCRFKLVASIHGADLFPNGKPKSHYSRSIQFLLNTADLIITPSQNTLKAVITVFPHLQSKGMFIHNGINLDEFVPESFLPFSGKEYILCVATHEYKKGIDVLIQAFARFNSSKAGLELWLVGEGPIRGELEQLVRDLDLETRVKFLGSRNRAEIWKLMHQCTLFVLPSRAEPFGIVLLEALACRKPIIATAVGGIPEIIEHGKNGILVEPENPEVLSTAIETVLQNKELQETLSWNGYESVKYRFQWETAATKYVSVFQRLLATKEGSFQ